GLAVVGSVFGSLLLLASFFRRTMQDDAGGTAVLERGADQSSPTLSLAAPSVVQPLEARGKPSSLSLWFVVLCCQWILAVEVLTWSWYHWPNKGLAAAAPWSIQW